MQKVLLVFLICSALAFVESKPERNMDWWTKGNAVTFKSASFEESVGKDKDIVVQFCAQFSAECHNIVPEYEELVAMYSGDNAKRQDVVIAKLDGWTFNAIPQEYGIRNFPEIVLFRKGSKEIASKFEGGPADRTAKNMSEWIEKILSQPPGSEKVEQDIPQADHPIPQADQAIPQADQAIPQADQPAATTNNEQAQQTQEVPPPQQAQQTQEPAKPVETQQNTQTTQGSEEDKRELKLVLNTTLLQDQFTDVNNRLETLGNNINNQNNANTRNIEELKNLVQNQKQEIINLQNTLRTFEAQKTELNNLLNHAKDHSSRIDLLSQSIASNKKDLLNTVQETTQKSIEEVKTGLEKIRSKVYEAKIEEPKESGMGGITMLLLGAVIGGAVGFVVSGLTGKKAKKGYLLD